MCLYAANALLQATQALVSLLSALLLSHALVLYFSIWKIYCVLQLEPET